MSRSMGNAPHATLPDSNGTAVVIAAQLLSRLQLPPPIDARGSAKTQSDEFEGAQLEVDHTILYRRGGGLHRRLE